jgi:hypothetical protein
MVRISLVPTLVLMVFYVSTFYYYYYYDHNYKHSHV